MNKFNKLKTKIKWKATKNYEIFMPSIFFLCVCMYKMCQISNQAYGKCEIEIINDKEYF